MMIVRLSGHPLVQDSLRVVTKKQLDHEFNIVVRGQPGDTSERIFRKL
jgi:hypothetical protein